MSKSKLGKIFVIDLEATCWEDQDRTRNEGELIEIGVVPIDIEFGVIEYDRCWRSFIRPRKTTVSDYCQELTGITQADLEKYGKPFDEVMNTVRNNFSRNYPYAGWGEYDGKMIDKTCREYGIKSPFSSRYINLKTLSCLLLGYKKECGLASVMKQENIIQEGKQHRALDDAINTAKVFLKAAKVKRNG